MIMSSMEALQNEHLMQTSRAGAVTQGESTAWEHKKTQGEKLEVMVPCPES